MAKRAISRSLVAVSGSRSPGPLPAATEFESRLREELGVSITVHLAEAGTVPRTEVGKAIRIQRWAGGEPHCPASPDRHRAVVARSWPALYVVGCAFAHLGWGANARSTTFRGVLAAGATRFRRPVRRPVGPPGAGSITGPEGLSESPVTSRARRAFPSRQLHHGFGGPFRAAGYPAPVRSGDRSRDVGVQDRLREGSEMLTGV
jgi:hypothetical protein